MAEKVKKEETSDEIIVRDPQVLRPVDLPLVIELPDSASEAQKEFAKVLNAYAYKNPEKWAVKKDDSVDENGKTVKGLISKLKDLKNAPAPKTDDKLTFKNRLVQ